MCVFRSTLCYTKLLEPAPKDAQQVTAQLLRKRMTQKRYYDASSHPLQPLTEGQVVRMQTPKGYDHLGTVKEVNKEPRSYTIQCNGRTYRRNRCHILPVGEPPPSWFTPVDIDFQNTMTQTQVFPIHHKHTSHSQDPHLLSCQNTQYIPLLRLVVHPTEHVQVVFGSRFKVSLFVT